MAFLLVLLPFRAEAVPCDFELAPQITATQTVYNYTMNASNSSIIDNVTSASISFNLSQFLKSGSQYIANYSLLNNNNLTQSQTLAYLSFDCNETKTFFIINSSNQTIVTKPNETVSFNFILAPRTFSDYMIKSWGIFNISETNINISNPYYYNVSAIMPDAERGTYRQVFEVRNGLESQYLTYYINNTGVLHPRILKSEVPETITYGKIFNVSFIADNVDSVNVELLKNGERVSGFGLKRQSNYLFEGAKAPLDFADAIKVTFRNNYTSEEKYYNITTEKPDFDVQDMIYPSLMVNYTSFIELIDFKVDSQIPITVTAIVNPINTSENSTNATTINADYYFANEYGSTDNEQIQAKKLYLYINPHAPERGRIEVTISSPAFDNRTFFIEYLGGSFNNKPEMDINYYNKPTHCVLKGSDMLRSNYSCSFDLPIDYDVKNLQANEISMMQRGCDDKVSARDDRLKDANMRFYILLGFNIIMLLGGVIYYVGTRTRIRF